MKPRILLTNDDGIEAEGLRRLRAAIEPLGRITVVAPEGEQSGTSHALTIHRPLRVRRRAGGDFGIDGTPTDCVHLGLTRLLEERPALVVSGINLGSNVGEDVTYSGTVAAALEASLHGLPAFAVSLQSTPEPDFAAAARFARRLAERVLAEGLPAGIFLNVNVPPGTPAAVRWTRQGRRLHGDPEEGVGDDGNYLWVRRNRAPWDRDPDADVQALRRGAISITPLRADWSDAAARRKFAGWEFDPPAAD